MGLPFGLTELEVAAILAEVADHSAFWNSDRCKRVTVEKHLGCPPREEHLGRKSIERISEKIDWLIVIGRLQCFETRSGQYIKVPGAKVEVRG